MTTKRYRRRNAKPGQVIVYYGKVPHESPDVVTAWGGGGATKRHANLVTQIFANKNLRIVYGDERKANGGLPYRFEASWTEELIAAGFDITTLKFSIELKKVDHGK